MKLINVEFRLVPQALVGNYKQEKLLTQTKENLN